jgi:hypothetical protein
MVPLTSRVASAAELHGDFYRRRVFIEIGREVGFFDLSEFG